MNGQISQGSILGPLLFNVFINDICQALGKSPLYNYADDNTLSYAHHNAETVIQTLQQDCSSLLHWFQENQMKVKPYKFQVISFGKRWSCVITDFKCDMKQLECEDSVVLIGIALDNVLTFNDHITDICQTSARQLAVLKRLGHLLTLQVAIFKYFISSNFNYCPLIGHLCSQCNTNKLLWKSRRERALLIVYNDYILSRRSSQDRWAETYIWNGPRSVQNCS